MDLSLASASPRRQELLKLFGVPFTVRVASIDETMDENKSAYVEVSRVSRLKAEATPHNAEDVVIAADTIVVCDGKILGKPKDEADALQMLMSLQGRQHTVCTGVTVRQGDKIITESESTEVYFRSATEAELRSYIATGEPMDKAGSYGIQEKGALLVEKINGDFFNVMGLPVLRLSRMLEKFGLYAF